MSAQVTISQLPAAGAITGTELVPIVQNGQTVQTTTSAISSSPNQTQTFLTKNQEPTLPNSRRLSSSNGVGLVDGGAQSTLLVTLNGTSGSLETAGNGIIAKTSGTVTPRSLLTSGVGLGVTNGDGVSGNPTFYLDGISASLANLSGTGVLALTGGGNTVSGRDLVGTANQVDIANGSGESGNPTFSIADNAVMPGVEGMTIPAGTSAERPSPANEGEVRYNTDTLKVEAYLNGTWTTFGTGNGTVTSVSGTANQISVANGSTTPVVSIATNPVIPGAGSITVPTGDTASRPVTPVNGMMRYNSETGLFEGYLTGAWSAFTSGGGSGVTSVATGTGLTGGPITSTGTISIDSTVVTLTGTQTLTNKTLASPAITGTVKLTGSGASSYTPFIQTFSSSVTNYNGYQLNYIQNTNNGSDASVDYVAYNDASDVDSYFIDMGIVSSNYTNALNTVFPANSGYVYTGGGTSGQASPLLFGTSNTNSDITFFTGGTLLANTRATIKGTGNFLIGTTTDTGYKLNVAGTTYFSGASTFGSTVLLNADPTIALQAATKQYVDNQVTAGLHIHEPVRVETTGNLTATYVQGGTTFNITDITSGTTVTTSASHGLSVNDQIWLYTSAGNGLSTNTAYFVYSVPAVNQLTLSLTFGGSQITGLTNASGLTYATRANSGVGATLTNSGAQAALTVDGIALSSTDRVMVRLQTNGAENGVYVVTDVGSIITNWVLTRATDSNQVNPSDPNGVGTGDYYFTREGLLNAGDSHVLTTEPNTMIIGYTTLTYTQFSGGVDYVGGTNITVTGQTIDVSGTIAATLGGTGTSTVTTGDLLYGSATNTWSKLPLGIAYKSLIVNAAGTQVEWNAIPLNQTTAVSGQLGTGNGGTGLSTYTAGDLVYYSTGTALSKLGIGASTYILTSSGSAPQYTDPASITVGAATTATTATSATSATTATNLAGGIASQIPYQTAAGTTAFIANGTAGQVLTSAGTSAPVWSGISGGTF
jgi:fibronectin-binding autotransporter adhesin